MHQLHALFLNLLLVILLSAVASYVSLTTHKQKSWGLEGAVFGLCVMLVMSTPLVVGQGRIVDFRGVMMTLAGYAGGASAALIAGILGVCYRLWVGGAGATSGALSIVTYGLLGFVLQRYLPLKKLASPLIAVTVGFVLAGIDLAFSQNVSMPIILFTPLAMLGCSGIFALLIQHLRSYAVLNAAFEEIGRAHV